MAEKLKAEQREAVENRGGKLLVSAAAGSGKTAVLVERIIKKITDTENPVSATYKTINTDVITSRGFLFTLNMERSF